MPEETAREAHEYELAKLRIQLSSDYVGKMIWQITIIAGAISVIVVVSVVIIAVVGLFTTQEVKIPDVLSNWGGIILGFYFGQFVNLVKDFMGIVSGTTGAPQPLPAPRLEAAAATSPSSPSSGGPA